jgi:DNA relaxase NicK
MATGEDSLLITELAVDDLNLLETKVTRVDLCIDIAFENNQRGWLKNLRYNDDFLYQHNRTGREISLIDSLSGETLYIGKRTSGRFGRIYDKSSLYGLEQGWVYRFELETKKNVAKPVFDALFPRQNDGTLQWDGFENRIRATLKSQFRRWGVSLKQNSDENIVIRGEARITSEERQLEWLRRSVAPVVEKLTRNGYRQAAFDAILGGENARVV